MGLSDKIIQYLEKELSNATDTRDIANRKLILDYFKISEGECVGLSTLWIYGRRIADEPEEGNVKPKDDIAFFNHVKKMLLEWEGKTEFTHQQKEDIERFISHILFFQRFDLVLLKANKAEPILQIYDQKDLPSLLEDTKREKPVEKRFSLEEMTLTKSLLVSYYHNGLNLKA